MFSKLIAIVLSIIILVSGIAIPVATHYCGDYVESVAVFDFAESCKMEMEVKNCSNNHAQIDQKSCCSDRIISNISSAQEYQTSNQKFDFLKLTLLKVFFSHFFVQQLYFQASTTYKNPPPFLSSSSNFAALLCIFRI